MPLAALFHRNPHRHAALSLYGRIVEQARQPELFARWGVPDTLDGRFETLALHAFLVLNRLKREGNAAGDLGQSLFDAMFADLDRGLREMGAGDLGVGRRVKAMAQAFYGRIVAYEAGLAGDEATLVAALRRNLYGTVTPRPQDVAALAAYTRRQAGALKAQATAALLAGEVRFAPLAAAEI